MAAATREVSPMAVKLFPARISGKCALCGKAYDSLDMVGFYPNSQISHADCALNPQSAIKPPLRIVKSEHLDEFKAALDGRISADVQPMPFQVEGAYHIERFGCRALLADEQGLGKTIQAILILAKHPKARPAVVIVPSSVKLNWRVEIKRWLPRTKRNRTYILNGRTPVDLPDTGIFIINYDIVKYWLPQLRKVNPQIVVCDESQYIKNPQAQRTKAILGGRRRDEEALCDGVPNRLFLSGTPAENRPVELWPVIHNLRPDVFSNYMQFANRYCAAYPGRFGLNVSGASNIAELSALLRKTCMIRRTKAEVLPELPPKRRVTVPMEIDNRNEYQLAHDDLIAWMKSQDQDITGALKAEALVKIEKLKQIAARGMVAGGIEWVNNFLTGGKKLVVYCHHEEVFREIVAALKEHNPAQIHGRQDAEEKQENTQKFQTDDSCRVVVCSLTAARLGITLTAASDTVFFELGWTPTAHDQAEDRTHRIGQTQACMAYYLLAAKTIYGKIAALIDSKRAVISGLIDQREIKPDENILESLISDLKAE
jgi:SWI/SNF-related matrix-associated actin-dependent regulator 1 of chromatin subfamily A